MLFRNREDIDEYAKPKYSTIAAGVFCEICINVEQDFWWPASLAKGDGIGSNETQCDTPTGIPDAYEDFETPWESYGFVLFWYLFDTEFELEERMPLADYVLFLEDANSVAIQVCPENEDMLRKSLAQALEKVRLMQEAHAKWAQENGVRVFGSEA